MGFSFGSGLVTSSSSKSGGALTWSSGDGSAGSCCFLRRKASTIACCSIPSPSQIAASVAGPLGPLDGELLETHGEPCHHNFLVGLCDVDLHVQSVLK